MKMREVDTTLRSFGRVRIPALVSPVGVNAEIVEEGVTGFHCRSDKDWETAILRILKDEVLRLKIGQAGRERIVQNYSVDAQNSIFYLSSSNN